MAVGRRLGRDNRTGRRGLEVPPSALSPLNKGSSSSVSIVHCPVRRYAAKDRAEILAEHLKEQFILHPAPDLHSIVRHHAEVKHRVREFLSAPIPPLPGDYYVFPTETAWTIFRLPKRKVPGPDGIPTIAIKQLPRRTIVAMTRLFNGILRTGHFPASWKTGRVIDISKAGKDPQVASSQRPITLLSHIAKLFERVLVRRLLRHLTPRQEQFWFRSGWREYCIIWPSSTTGGAGPLESFSISSVALRTAVQAHWKPDPARAGADSSVVPERPRLLRNSRRRHLGPASHQRRCTTRQLPIAVLVRGVHR
ncbi:Probable RNA-directed DNA polymerase from transposon X-element [Eumeta japonica]|uniref:Probable RNA-directed DNA polymerase from transposon X-element n=1 Tax=Eumeta variegata TaxID=151549 RepID=A0A4C1TBT7_EUMVA|nr:Probable RNA-directed DNA polymerase from transposon X-element [Eumeta japonica]